MKHRNTRALLNCTLCWTTIPLSPCHCVLYEKQCFEAFLPYTVQYVFCEMSRAALPFSVKSVYGFGRYLEDRVPRVQALVQDRRSALGPSRVLRTQLPLSGPGQLWGRHVSCGPSSHCPVQGSSGAATCPADPASAARLGVAPGPPRVPRTQLPLPGPGQLRGCRVSCGLSSRCLARGSSGVAACALEAQRSACY
jgi:hypothetical protein